MGATGPIVLLTRPRAASERVAAELQGAAEVLIAPLIEIVPVGAVPALAGLGALILTSANAAERLSDVPAGLPAYCVGDRTAEAARERGCAAVSAGGDAEALVARLLEDRPGGRLLHLRGETSRGDIAERLSVAGLRAESAVIYRQETRAFDPAARARLADASRILAPVYSPMSAGALADAWPDDAPSPHIVAISPAAAEAWGRPARALTIADRPDGGAMIRAIRAALDTDGPCS